MVYFWIFSCTGGCTAFNCRTLIMKLKWDFFFLIMALETFYWLAWKLPVAGSLGFQNRKERNSAIHRVTKAGLWLGCNFVRKWVITHNVTEVWDGRLAWLQERSGVFFLSDCKGFLSSHYVCMVWNLLLLCLLHFIFNLYPWSQFSL